MLRKARIILSVVIFGLITFYFLDFAEILPNSFHRLAHIQFVPALMSLSFIILKDTHRANCRAIDTSQ